MEENKKDKNAENEIMEETQDTVNEEAEAKSQETEAENTENGENAEDSLKKEVEQLKDKIIRHAAEFDNYKKRTQKEREELYSMAVCDTVEKILPVKDNLERAVLAAEGTDGGKEMADGVKMILKQLDDVLAAIGVTEIKAVGESFDPEKHNAVMHEENEDFGENTVSEELMKGYIYKDSRVVRHSMVKVAN